MGKTAEDTKPRWDHDISGREIRSHAGSAGKDRPLKAARIALIAICLAASVLQWVSGSLWGALSWGLASVLWVITAAIDRGPPNRR